MNASTESLASEPSDKRFFIINGVVSVLALAFLSYILVLRDPGAQGTARWNFLPAVNATFNGLSAACLAAGWVAIRKGAKKAHRGLMLSAFVSSSCFLVSYLIYHFVHGDTKYPPGAPVRGLYFFVLISHIVLSVPVVPAVLSSFYFAFRGRFAAHRKVTAFTLPVWLYVSITGVVVYLMLRASGAYGA